MSGGGSIPRNPFEVDITKELVRQRIEAGDIEQKDLDIIKKGYAWMSTASFLGSVGMGVPAYLFMRRKLPPASFGLRLLVGGGMGMLGSFLGFTLGGAAAAFEVNKSMENPQQKLRVFAEIATEARRASIERSAGGIPSPSSTRSTTPPGALGSRTLPRPQSESIGVETSPSTWASESALDRSEMAAEAAREGGFKSEIGDIRRDSGFVRPTTPNVGGTGDSWGKLRGAAMPSAESEGDRGLGVGGKGQMRENERLGSTTRSAEMGQGGKTDDARTAEQKEFDALLERERKGLGSGGDDKWA